MKNIQVIDFKIQTILTVLFEKDTDSEPEKNDVYYKFKKTTVSSFEKLARSHIKIKIKNHKIRNGDFKFDKINYTTISVYKKEELKFNY